MRRLLPLAVAALCLGSSCSTTIKKPFLWEIEKDGKTSYILGSQHLGVRYSDLPDFVFEKLDSANIVLAEADIKNADEPMPKRKSRRPH